jgi:hypothetical protein
MAGLINNTADTAGGEKSMKAKDTKKTKEMDIVHFDGNPKNNHIENLQPKMRN